MPLTPSQLEAVQARGNVIVVAGAGTGKTSTLIERCIALMAGGKSIERILMVTFTEAAAAEMRHRLHGRLAKAVADSAEDAVKSQGWQEQLALLDTARISTMHGFCLQLIREDFHLLGIDPSVKVLDEQQTRPLIEDALDECLKPHFAGTDEVSVAVRELIQRYAQGDAEKIRSLVLKLHGYSQSLDAPKRWFESQLAALAADEPRVWRDWLATELRDWSRHWLPELERDAAKADNLQRCVLALEQLIDATANRSTDASTTNEASDAILEILAAEEADWPRGLKGKLRDPLKPFFAEAEFFASQFAMTDSGDGLKSDWENVRRSLRASLGLAREFGGKYDAAKRELGGVDFADLEQLTLALLLDDEGRPTQVALRWQTLLEDVFVDECQDINAAQDAILRAVSRGAFSGTGVSPVQWESELQTEAHVKKKVPAGRQDACPTTTEANRFLVGDVKQSIYQFRLARPALFRGYEKAWEKSDGGRRILLSDNFRSAPEIIHFVNALFDPLMRDAIGGVEYEALKPGRETGQCAMLNETERRVEFHLLPKASNEREPGEEEVDGEENVDDLLATEREARLVALRLRDLRRSEFQVWDKDAGVLRAVEWGDMAVLLRSPRNRVEAFAKEFHKCGVPLQAARGGFLASTEISDLLCLVRLLDNPLQDIPLLAVLRSPLAALNLDELAEIRSRSGADRLWDALKEFHKLGVESRPPGLERAWEKTNWFLTRFAEWRELVRLASLSHSLETALAESDYEAVIKAGERGAERAANIRKFVETVRQYDPFQRQGLSRFLKFVEGIEAADEDIEPAPVQTQDAVRLMSIHKSKGLEFPVVVVACLGGLFNVSDLNRDVLLDDEFGVCAKAVTDGGKRHPTLAHWLAARRQRRQVLGEELRLLYVAATRARDRLLLTGTATKKEAENWTQTAPRDFTSREILAARSPLDWLMLWLPTVTASDANDSLLLKCKVWTDANELRIANGDAAADNIGEAGIIEDAGLGPQADEVKQRIQWRYEHEAASRESAKTSVTALRGRAAEIADEEAKPWAYVQQKRADDEPRPDAAKSGTLHHKFLQRISITGACDESDLRQQLATLVELRVFKPDEACELDVSGLAKFWQGEIGSAIRAEAARVRRELPFTARFSPVDLERITGEPVLPELGDEFVIVQGVADLVVVREEELWLLDFKTDDVDASGIEQRAAMYSPQLKLYAAALEGIYGRPVTRSWLHFVRPGVTHVAGRKVEMPKRAHAQAQLNLPL